LAAVAWWAAAIALIFAFGRVRGTTLVGPWGWAIVSMLLAGFFVLPSMRPLQTHFWQRFLISTSTLCPAMAVLGAKRPHHRVWQGVVIVFWLMISQPAFEAAFLRHQPSVLFVHPLRSWFLTLALAMGVAIYLPTRFAPCALLAGLGQSALLSPYLPLHLWTMRADLRWLCAGVLIGLAIVIGWIIAQAFPRAASLPPLHRAWRDFRDAWGTAWALRVSERFEADARACGWNATLLWSGFCGRNGEPLESLSPETIAALEAWLRTVLGRFVSAEWIAERLD
jgi:hypothetical protein